MSDAEVTAHLASSQIDGVSHVQGTLTASPDTLIRTMEGQITFWSPDLQQRYGFACSEALGRTAHQLLRTIFPLKSPETEATLAYQKTWSGMMTHRHADGRGVMTVNHWYLPQLDFGHLCSVAGDVDQAIDHGGRDI